MIHLEQLISRWHQALRWNGVLFFISQCGKTVSSWILFTHLSATHYAALANVQSLVFLAVLILDLGLSRALPQFCLSFAHNARGKKQFIYTVIQAKIAITIISTLIGLGVLLYIQPILSASLSVYHLAILGFLLFIIESTRSLLRLVFYAYLWHKRYNIGESILIGIRTIMMIGTSLYYTDPQHIVYSILIIEIVISLCIVMRSLCLLPKLLKDPRYSGEKKLDHPHLLASFMKHSLAMWTITSIGTLSQRNVLVPLFSFVGNAEVASLFKVSNDMALLVERFILKTIGTTDTTLFAHATTQHIANAKHYRCVYSELWDEFHKKLLLLTIPLAGLVIFVFTTSDKHQVVTLFSFLSLCYLGRLLFIGYRRQLEISRKYRLLLYSMTPYGLIILLYWLLYIKIIPLTLETLLPILLGIQTLSLLSCFLRMFFADKLSHQPYPYSYVGKIAGYTMIVFCAIYVPCRYLHVSPITIARQGVTRLKGSVLRDC